ncbi:MAG: DUF1684 domain-containing protein [Bacteroidota bacterium]
MKRISPRSLWLVAALVWTTLSLTAQDQLGVKAATQDYRQEYKDKFLAEKRSPFYGKAEALKQLRFYPPKAAYRVDGRFERTPDADIFDMATYSGKTRKYVQYGWIHYQWKGEDKKIAVYQSLRLRATKVYGDYLFVPFKDETNDKKTYGGGRYIDLKISDIEDDQVVLDFNRSYNPYCAFSDGYSCPIPPRENHLDWSVKAGEKVYQGDKLQ